MLQSRYFVMCPRLVGLDVIFAVFILCIFMSAAYMLNMQNWEACREQGSRYRRNGGLFAGIVLQVFLNSSFQHKNEGTFG